MATSELAAAGRRVILLEQEPPTSLGGQAFWSFGGLLLVDSPEQRRLGIRDSHELALQDWMGSAAFDRPEDEWPRRWAEAYVAFAAGEKRVWLHARAVRWFPAVQWAERGGYLATGHGNSVPRFHVAWGTGPGLIEPFVDDLRSAVAGGRVSVRFRHRVTGLAVRAGVVEGVTSDVLTTSRLERGTPSRREVVEAFELVAGAVVVIAGGIGANDDLLRRNWPARLGAPPRRMLSGVPDYVDGRMLEVVAEAGGALVNADRMWSYPEGIRNYAPIWSPPGIRILSGPSPLWLDATGRRLPIPLFPGFDSLGALEHITGAGHDHSWFVLNRRIIRLGAEPGPDRAQPSRPVGSRAARRYHGGRRIRAPGPDFVTAGTAADLAAGMIRVTGERLVDAALLESEIVARDREIESGFGKDAQVMAIHAARRYRVDRLSGSPSLTGCSIPRPARWSRSGSGSSPARRWADCSRTCRRAC
ncbi:MAG: FAD-binding dehydrogenase [Chloroflexota bacterium]